MCCASCIAEATCGFRMTMISCGIFMHTHTFTITLHLSKSRHLNYEFLKLKQGNKDALFVWSCPDVRRPNSSKTTRHFQFQFSVNRLILVLRRWGATLEACSESDIFFKKFEVLRDRKHDGKGLIFDIKFSWNISNMDFHITYCPIVINVCFIQQLTSIFKMAY